MPWAGNGNGKDKDNGKGTYTCTARVLTNHSSSHAHKHFILAVWETNTKDIHGYQNGNKFSSWALHSPQYRYLKSKVETKMKFLLGLAAASATVGCATSANMNGDYLVASGGKTPVQYNDDYGSRGQEYFDVWAPEMATQYAQVFWTSQGTLPLPADIVERFKGKVIAITGYEQDQVMVTPTGHPGVNPDQDVSVPINWAYNHHYMAWMTGANAEFKEVPSDGFGDWMAHGAETKIIAVEKEGAPASPYPSSQMYSEGNGGESRKSFHGYPKGYAQLLESPTSWTITPMQIDTRNRDCGVTKESITNCTEFVPFLEPKQSRYGLGIPEGTNYSGVLECPCNSAYGGDQSMYGDNTPSKHIAHGYAVSSTSCSATQIVADNTTCYKAASDLGINTVSLKSAVVSSATLPNGCSLTRDPKDGSVTAIFNKAGSSTAVTQSKSQIGETSFPETGVKVHLSLVSDSSESTFVRSAKGVYCKDNHANVLSKFVMADASTASAETALNSCEKYCAGDAQCTVCSVDCSLGSMKRCQWVALPECGTTIKWGGLIPGDISSKSTGGNVTITMSGPADVWFGVGFNAGQMSDQPYTLIANASGVIEQKIGTCGSEAEHCPGTQLAPSATLVSNDVDGSTRTIVLTREFQGKDTNYYTFTPATKPSIPLISAIGSTPVFAYHAAHGVGGVTLLNADGTASPICDHGETGELCDGYGQNCHSFVKNCLDEDNGGDLLFQNNPTCNSVQYAGGLQCCHHGRIMLDQDQTCDNCGDLLRYHMKFRFWFEEYTPATATTNASHLNLDRLYWQTESDAGEYDIPPAFVQKDTPIPGYPDWPADKPTPGTHCTGTCPDGPDCDCYHEITYRWSSPGMRLIYAGGHCHAPSCISLELFRNDTGKLEIICGQYPVYGKGNVRHDKWDEAGYLTIPPCLWGDEGELEPSVFLPAGTPLVSIKRNRNTHMGHYGEMASWQMRGTKF